MLAESNAFRLNSDTYYWRSNLHS